MVNGRTYPESKTDASTLDLGNYIRFFEQAFEWEQMMYFCYPYYWGRKENWYDRVRIDHPDPLFADFLRAGAARVVVPVRPGFEFDIQYFLERHCIWGCGGVPKIGSKRYLSIVEEIRASQDAPGNETPQGEPWEVTVPTTLVRLRPELDGTLPRWERTPPIPPKKDAYVWNAYKESPTAEPEWNAESIAKPVTPPLT